METPRNWRKLEVHELAEIFPPMSEVERTALKTGMETNGYDKKQPVLLFDGKILDGRHRRDVAAEVGKEPTFDEYKGNDPVTVVIQRNLHRRHLNESQRGLVGGRLASLNSGGGIGKNHDLANLQDGLTQPEAAALLNVSPRTIADGRKVATEGSKVLQDAVADGTVKVSDAAKIVDEPAKVQSAAVKAVESGKATTVASVVKPKKKRGGGVPRKPKDPKKASKEAHDLFGKLIRYADSLASGKPKFKSIRDQFQKHLQAAKDTLVQLERATEVK